MFFKSLLAYELQEMNINAAELAHKLEAARFQPIGKLERRSIGFVSPCRHAAHDLVHAVAGNLLICICSEEKILPADVVRRHTDSLVRDIEDRESRKVGRKERKEIAERAADELLPQAFTRQRKLFALVTQNGNALLINSASRSQAETMLDYLRRCLTEFPVRPVVTQASPIEAMTDWLIAGEAPANFVMETEVDLELPEEGGARVRCVHQDVHADEVRCHLNGGKRVTKLALTWADRISFVLTFDMALKRLNYLDLVQDDAKSAGAYDDAEQFDANLAIMAGEFGRMLPELFAAMGGKPN